MRLRARLFPIGEGTQRILETHLPLREFVAQSARYPVDADNPVLQRILEAGEGAGGFWVSGEAVFSPGETRTITHFELASRSLVPEVGKDFEANDAVRAQSRLIEAGGERPIRLMRGLSLSHITLKPHMVGSVGEWLGEYIIGASVAQAFAQAGLTGFALIPVTNAKTQKAHEAYFQIFSDSILPPAVVDRSVERLSTRVAEEDGQLRHLGCLSYERAAVANAHDFNRSAEPWMGWHGWPSWVVSARVMQTFKQAKLRGWHFRPVLLTDTPLYQAYLAQWTKLRALVEGYPTSTMDGGRW